MSDLLEFVGLMVMGVAGLALAALIVFGLPVYVFGDRSVADLNINAPAYLKTLGYEVVGREGFTYGVFSQPGGCVWYSMRRAEQPQTIYTGCVSRWHNGTYELWGPRAINAVSGH